MSSRLGANLASGTSWRGRSEEPGIACGLPAQLVEAATGAQVWADRFEGDLDESSSFRTESRKAWSGHRAAALSC